MAELHGKTGAVYAATSIIRGTGISFAAINTISDSGNGFVTAGFVQGQKIIVVGSTNNDHTFTITTGGVAAGSLTVSATPDAVEDESAGALITIYQAPAGVAVAGCTEWSADTTCAVHDVTTFEDAGQRSFLAGLKGWSGTARRFWQASDDRWGGSGLATFQWIRLFEKYVASPSAGDPAYFHEGLAIVTAINMTAPSGDVIGQNLTFQGVGALTFTTQTSSW